MVVPQGSEGLSELAWEKGERVAADGDQAAGAEGLAAVFGALEIDFNLRIGA